MNFMQQSSAQIKLKYLALALVTVFFLQGCSSDGSPRFKDVEEIEVSESTKGVICEVEEVEPGNEFKVIEEQVIDDKMASMAIVHNLDGTVDSVSLHKMKKDESSYHRSSVMRPFLMGTLAGTFFNRNMNRHSLDPSRYKSTDAFNKSKGLRSGIASSATTRRMKVPGKGSRGYGKGKSFRSFGG